MYGRKPPRAVRGAWRWRERRRFVEVEADCDDALYSSAYLAQLRGLPPDEELDCPLFADAQRGGRPAGARSSTELGRLAYRLAALVRRRCGVAAGGRALRREVELINVAPGLPSALADPGGW